ncbi:MAG: DUF11 domain-containing protein [Pirellulales bacterium]|nr:DUF11 domain-containing protein [Pirellulales bacterium]
MRACLLRGSLMMVFGLFFQHLAAADDSFSAARKSAGATRYASSARVGNAASQTPPTTSPFSPSVLREMPEHDSTPLSVLKPAASTHSKVQEIFPTASTSPAEPAVTSIPSSDTAAAPASSSGLKSLQQRFSILRKLAGSKPPEDSNASPLTANESPLVDQPMAAPRPATAGTTIPAPGLGVPSPAPPTVPDLRAAPRTVTSPPIAVEATVAAPVAASERPRSPASVGGPVTSSRRMPTGQAAGLPREDRESDSASIEATASSGQPTSSTSGASVLSNSIRSPAGAPVRSAATKQEKNLLFSRQSPVLSVETAGPRSITIGKEATYVVSVVNSGDAAAQDVKVSIRIPPWTEVVGATATGGAAQAVANKSEAPLTWNLPRLEENGKEQLSLRLVPRESRPFDLAVQWTFSPVVSQAMVEVKEPKLAMSVAGAEEILYGETKVYKLSISNPGTGDAENVVLFLSPVDGNSGSPTRHEIGNVAAGENKLVEVELTARQAGTLAIKGTATADGNLRAEAAQQILVRRAGLKVATEGPELTFAGTPAEFHVTVKNPGNAAADAIQVAALLPTGAKYVSSNGGQFVAEQHKVVWTIPSLRSGGQQEFEVQCILNSPGSNRLQVVALAASDLSDTTAMSTNVEALADLKLEVSDPRGPVPVGESVPYEIRIRNRGTKAAENVSVHGFFSGGIEPQSAEGGLHELVPGQVVFKPIASITPGAEVVLKIQAKAEQAGNHVFRTEVNCPAIGMKLAAEETTLFYGDLSRSARLASRPSESSAPVKNPVKSSEQDATIVR